MISWPGVWVKKGRCLDVLIFRRHLDHPWGSVAEITISELPKGCLGPFSVSGWVEERWTGDNEGQLIWFSGVGKALGKADVAGTGRCDPLGQKGTDDGWLVDEPGMWFGRRSRQISTLQILGERSKSWRRVGTYLLCKL